MPSLFRLLATAALLMASLDAHARRAHADETPWSAVATADAVAAAMREHLFDPRELGAPAFQAALDDVDRLAATSPSREAFIAGFNARWSQGPVSHVRLEPARGSADQMADYVDTLRVGGKGAALRWEGDTAVLRVDTMMGLDTIEQIDAAYAEIVAHKARALVIDLRANPGGAFAVVPLVGHAIARPLDAGVFLGAAWNSRGLPPPDRRAVDAMPAWTGWSLKRFWQDLERDGVLRIRFEPRAPHFAGPIYVLTGHRTASAAELAADALRAGGKAVVIGEATAGQMLSQRMFDVPGSLHLYVPIADYRSFSTGRIEGQGLRPDIEVPAGDALARALEMARGSR